jgi:hypothetical protein
MLVHCLLPKFSSNEALFIIVEQPQECSDNYVINLPLAVLYLGLRPLALTNPI